MKVYVVNELIYKIVRGADDYDTGVGGTVGVFSSEKKAIEYIFKYYNTKYMVNHHIYNRGVRYIFEDDNLRTVLTIRQWEVNKGEIDEMEALL